MSLGLLRRREVSMTALAAIFFSYLQSIFMAYLGIHLNSLQTTALIIGYIFGVRNLLQIFFRIPIGEFSQVVGRKPLIVSGIFLNSISFIFLYLATSWYLVLIGTLILGIGMSLYYPSLFASVGDIADNNYGRINGIVFQGSDIAIIIGSFAVSTLLDNNIVSLNGIFLISIVIGLIGTVVSYIALPETLASSQKVHVDSKIKAFKNYFTKSFSSFRNLSNEKGLGNIYRFQLVISFAEFFFQSFFGLLVTLSLGYEKSDVALIISVSALIIFLFKPYLGSVSDKFGYRSPILFSLTSISLLLILITYTTQIWMVIIIFALMMSLNVMNYLGVNGATSYTASVEKRGVAMGVLGVYVSLGRSLSSFLLGPLWDFFEQRSGDKGGSLIIVFRVAGIIVLLSMIVLAYISRVQKQILSPIDTSADMSITGK